MTTQFTDCTKCGTPTVPGGFCPSCGEQASGGGGLLALLGWLFIPLTIPVYPILGTLSTLAMVATHYVLLWIGMSDGLRIIAIAAVGYLSLFVTFQMEREASKAAKYRVFRQIWRLVILGGVAVAALVAGAQGADNGAGPLVAVIGGPLILLLAWRFDRVYGLAGPRKRKLRVGIDSYFVQDDIDGKGTRFEVTPGRVVRRKLALLAMVIFVTAVFYVADPESSEPMQAGIAGVAIVGGWLVYRLTKRLTARTALMAGGHFIVSPRGIELHDGTVIDRSGIARLKAVTTTSDRTAPVANVLMLERKTGDSVVLAGGMDATTSNQLLVAASRALGSDAATT